ncbi:hypothetical protein DPX16_22362 [Anabarilius grahami]|uniref:Uncharacterized protein n=1 Tax=Anabarilius grahami TaxID=495550 RepID=A0A3N0Y4M9_ANAGA|nr:hypothetical protein DPX16_22362 [Anabarilius grahami]
MEGEKQKRGKSKIGSKWEKGEITEDIDSGEEGRGKDGEQGTANKKVADIMAFRVDLKSDMEEFRLALWEDMRKELNEFREEIKQKMKEFSGDLQATTVRVTEMEQRIADTEEWNVAASDALLDMLETKGDAGKIWKLAPDGTTSAYMESKRDLRGFVYLIEVLTQHGLKGDQHDGGAEIPLKQKVALFLRYMANQNSFGEISDKLNLSQSSAHRTFLAQPKFSILQPSVAKLLDRNSAPSYCTQSASSVEDVSAIGLITRLCGTFPCFGSSGPIAQLQGHQTGTPGTVHGFKPGTFPFHPCMMTLMATVLYL